MPHVSVRFDSDLADRIEEVVESDPRYENQSQLVRTAVRRLVDNEAEFEGSG